MGKWLINKVIVESLKLININIFQITSLWQLCWTALKVTEGKEFWEKYVIYNLEYW